MSVCLKYYLKTNSKIDLLPNVIPSKNDTDHVCSHRVLYMLIHLVGLQIIRLCQCENKMQCPLRKHSYVPIRCLITR